MTGFENASTETLHAIAGNLRRGLDVIGQRITDGTFHTVGPKGAAPPAQAGHLTLALLDGVTTELARRDQPPHRRNNMTTDLTLPADQAAAIYDTLIEHAGARPDGRDDFIAVQTTSDCDEYRFQGALGFGGKFLIWQDRWSVSAYHDDVQRSPGMRDILDVTNAALATLRSGYAARGALT